MLRKLFRIVYHRSKIEESKRRYSFTQDFLPDAPISQQLLKKDAYSICFLLPAITAYSGGITGIFRLGTYLANFGHQVTYIDCNNAVVAESITNAKINFQQFKGDIITLQTLNTLNDSFDIGISTLWDTAYILKQYNARFSYKMYFIQDFEPAFYPLGDLYFMCSKTYQFGFHLVSLGPWNAKKIVETFPNLSVDYIDFPVELKVYELAKRKIKIDHQLDLAIFLKLEPKRAPDLLPQCLIALQHALQAKGIKLNCWIFGTDISLGLPFAKSLGMLKHDALQALYTKCQIGLVASFTNISYVTFEMISRGLPVIEFAEGSAPMFFKENELIFVDSAPINFSNKIVYYLEHQDQLNNVVVNSQKAIQNIPWEKSAKAFNDIIMKIE